MTAFALAAAALFADPHQARDVGWWPGGLAPMQTVRGIVGAPDDTTGFGDTFLQTETTILSVRVAEVPTPTEGDRFTVDGAEYVVQGSPRRDALRLVWRLVLVPEAME